MAVASRIGFAAEIQLRQLQLRIPCVTYMQVCTFRIKPRPEYIKNGRSGRNGLECLLC